ncbi:hypothetical protein TNCV_4972781 [Trichonephila clavipes]|nr:hypothetical protein TNCV_4972781 [Trichonephila clavipes]
MQHHVGDPDDKRNLRAAVVTSSIHNESNQRRLAHFTNQPKSPDSFDTAPPINSNNSHATHTRHNKKILPIHTNGRVLSWYFHTPVAASSQE